MPVFFYLFITLCSFVLGAVECKFNIILETGQIAHEDPTRQIENCHHRPQELWTLVVVKISVFALYTHYRKIKENFNKTRDL